MKIYEGVEVQLHILDLSTSSRCVVRFTLCSFYPEKMLALNISLEDVWAPELV
jgi:hypothetical protein